MPTRLTLSNERTRIPHRLELFPALGRPSSSSAASPAPSSAPSDRSDDAFAVACARVGRERATALPQAAVAVVARWPLPGGGHEVFSRVLFFGAGATEPVALVLGRHSEVDTPPWPGASLRHAVLLAWPTAPGEPPRIEVIDLNTDVGLGVVGGGAAAHLESMGPLRVGVGAADVVIVPAAARAPLFPDGVDALLRRLSTEGPPVRRTRDDALAGGSLAAVLTWHDEMAAAAARDAPAEPSAGQGAARQPADAVVVRLLPERLSPPPRERLTPDWQTKTVARSSIVCTPARAAALPPQGRDVDDTPAPPFVVPNTWDQLHDGLLLGRYERCAGHAETAADLGISRVHALVVARRDRLYVVDTGSTNGTRVKRADGAVVELDARRRVMAVADDDQLWLHDRRCVVEVRGGDGG
ncbi:MAG: FHA domain-containing protein [Deltaproteobacteria bacterium]|nr:FHA domain-containing protein [Deltaproteobacteria bacterium]